MNGREKIPMFYWFLNKFAISNLYYKILLISGLQPSLTHSILLCTFCVRISPLGFVLTPTKVPIGTYHRQVIYMKSKASTTTSSSNTTRKDFCLVATPNLSLIYGKQQPTEVVTRNHHLYVSCLNSSNSASISFIQI